MKPTEILDAKEKRWHKRQFLSSQYKSTIITITVCLPITFRIGKDMDQLFFMMYDKVCDFLSKKNIVVVHSEVCVSADGYEAYLVVLPEEVYVKKACIEAENELVFGRILDMDVMNKNGVQIGRAELCIPPRKCFVCDLPAALCISQKRHTAAEVVNSINLLMQRIKSDGGL